MKSTLGSLLTLIFIAIEGNSENLTPAADKLLNNPAYKLLNNAEYTIAFELAAQMTLLNRDNSTQAAKIIEALIEGGYHGNELLTYQQAKDLVARISRKLNNPCSVFQSPVIPNNEALIGGIIDEAYRNRNRFPTPERAPAIAVH